MEPGEVISTDIILFFFIAFLIFCLSAVLIYVLRYIGRLSKKSAEDV